MHDRENGNSKNSQGKAIRNAARSGAERVPLMVCEANLDAPVFKFYVSKAKLVEGLKFIAEGHDAVQRQARRRQIFAQLIAASDK